MGGYFSHTIYTKHSQMCCTKYTNKVRIGYTANHYQRGIWQVKSQRSCFDQ